MFGVPHFEFAARVAVIRRFTFSRAFSVRDVLHIGSPSRADRTETDSLSSHQRNVESKAEGHTATYRRMNAILKARCSSGTDGVSELSRYERDAILSADELTALNKRRDIERTRVRAKTGSNIQHTRYDTDRYLQVFKAIDDNPNISYRHIAQALNIPHSTLYKWVMRRKREQGKKQDVKTKTWWPPDTIERVLVECKNTSAQQAAATHGIPFSTVYHWTQRAKCGAGRVMKKYNIQEREAAVAEVGRFPTIREAAQALAIPYSTLFNWISKARHEARGVAKLPKLSGSQEHQAQSTPSKSESKITSTPPGRQHLMRTASNILFTRTQPLLSDAPSLRSFTICSALNDGPKSETTGPELTVPTARRKGPQRQNGTRGSQKSAQPKILVSSDAPPLLSRFERDALRTPDELAVINAKRDARNARSHSGPPRRRYDVDHYHKVQRLYIENPHLPISEIAITTKVPRSTVKHWVITWKRRLGIESRRNGGSTPETIQAVLADYKMTGVASKTAAKFGVTRGLIHWWRLREKQGRGPRQQTWSADQKKAAVAAAVEYDTIKAASESLGYQYTTLTRWIREARQVANALAKEDSQTTSSHKAKVKVEQEKLDVAAAGGKLG